LIIQRLKKLSAGNHKKVLKQRRRKYLIGIRNNSKLLFSFDF